MTILPPTPHVSPSRRRTLERLIDSTRHRLPTNWGVLIRDELHVDLATRYAGLPIAHPFGKASGQLSCKASQVAADVAAGLAFVVLKTVIAEDPSGRRSMEAWAVPESKMRVERRTSAALREGWTVTWRGRGWHGTLEEYLDFFGTALSIAADNAVPVIPSVKYHLPDSGEGFRGEEYQVTTTKLVDVWKGRGCGGPLPLEKDFSPTLAGDVRARDRDRILAWLRQVPALVESAAPGQVRLGVKVMNALADDDFQVEMLRTLSEGSTHRPAFLVVFNRLFDPERDTAYGGWDLSDRNLRVLDAARRLELALPPLSATGNICSGRMMVEYALRGCENGQLHTFFQLPPGAYLASRGSRPARALMTLLLHPTEGLVPWLWHLHETGVIHETGGAIHFRDVVVSGTV